MRLIDLISVKNGVKPFDNQHSTRCWCPDRTVPQARKYISDSMGSQYAEAVLLNLDATWAESDPRVPLICFLSMGSDPTNQIESLCKKKQLGRSLHTFYYFVVQYINVMYFNRNIM